MSFNRQGFSNSQVVVKNLIVINVVMLVVSWLVSNRFNIDLNDKLGLYFFKSEHFKPFQYITHMFMHGGLTHLFFNMFALWMFGRVLESVWGSKRFLLYYFATGLGAAFLHTFVNYIQYYSLIGDANQFLASPTPELFQHFVDQYKHFFTPDIQYFLSNWYENPDNSASIQMASEKVQEIVILTTNIPTVGASGAVFGVLLAFGMLFPNTELFLLFPPIPIKAKYAVIGYGVLELYLGLTQNGSNIAHFAHLGGMLFGFLLIKYWQKHPPMFE